MTCVCPKCNSELQLDPAEITAAETFRKCESCRSNLIVRKESFAKRALFKSDKIHCAECGNSPGISICCQSCHAIYPDILIIETISATKKQLEKLSSAFNIFAKLKTKQAHTSHSERHGFFSEHDATQKKRKSAIPIPSKPVHLTMLALFIIIAVLAGGYFWYQDKLATEYSQKYIKTLLAIKTARDYEISVSNRIVASWKSGAGSSLTANEMKVTETAQKDIGTLLKRIDHIPEKFAANNDALNKLSESFSKLHATVVTPTISADAYAESVKKLDDDFIKTAKEMKTGFKGKLVEAFETVKPKYKTLQDM